MYKLLALFCHIYLLHPISVFSIYNNYTETPIKLSAYYVHMQLWGESVSIIILLDPDDDDDRTYVTSHLG